jgi:hypothetical protein
MNAELFSQPIFSYEWNVILLIASGWHLWHYTFFQRQRKTWRSLMKNFVCWRSYKSGCYHLTIFWHQYSQIYVEHRGYFLYIRAHLKNFFSKPIKCLRNFSALEWYFKYLNSPKANAPVQFGKNFWKKTIIYKMYIFNMK